MGRCIFPIKVHSINILAWSKNVMNITTNLSLKTLNLVRKYRKHSPPQKVRTFKPYMYVKSRPKKNIHKELQRRNKETLRHLASWHIQYCTVVNTFLVFLIITKSSSQHCSLWQDSFLFSYYFSLGVIIETLWCRHQSGFLQIFLQVIQKSQSTIIEWRKYRLLRSNFWKAQLLLPT